MKKDWKQSRINRLVREYDGMGGVCMEYRSCRRIRKKVDPQLWIASCVIAVVYIAIVFLICASRAGTWIAQTVIAPVFGLRAQADREDDTILAVLTEQGTDARSAELSLPGTCCYALQMGVYENAENANQQANALRAVGAGGYIKADGARYRVLAAGYGEIESLNKVKAQLKEQGVESTCFRIESAACRLSIAAAEEEIRAYESAIKHTAEVQQRLIAQAIEFDRQGMRVEDGVSMLCDFRDALKQARDAFKSRLSAATGVSDSVLDFYGTLILSLDDAIALTEPGRAEIASALKYAGLLAADLTTRIYRAVESI